MTEECAPYAAAKSEAQVFAELSAMMRALKAGIATPAQQRMAYEVIGILKAETAKHAPLRGPTT
jgi:hypothetical protein